MKHCDPEDYPNLTPEQNQYLDALQKQLQANNCDLTPSQQKALDDLVNVEPLEVKLSEGEGEGGVLTNLEIVVYDDEGNLVTETLDVVTSRNDAPIRPYDCLPVQPNPCEDM